MEQYTEEQKKRAGECSEEINKVLEKHNCQLSPMCVIDASGVKVRVPIIARPLIITPVNGITPT